jgi:predicted nucleotidyltransferase
MKQRAIRRHHLRRLKRNVREYYCSWAERDENKARIVGVLANTRTLCSCWMCGNPRRYLSEHTLAERRADLLTVGVKRLGLFGSFVRGDQATRSDVDLLVEFEEGRKTFDNFMQLSFVLEEVLQRRVELVTLESLSPYIGPHILREVEYAPLAA